MTQTYLDWYLAGEHEQVWSELVALGAAIRDEPVYTDARAVAQEMMLRARHNVELIVERLRILDYRFFEEFPQQQSDITPISAKLHECMAYS